MTMIDPVTLALVKSALDAGELRQVAHANNIANANTPGYRPFKVLFEERLEGVRNALADGSPGELSVADIPAARMVVDEGAPAPSLDSEVAATSENALHYQALTDALRQQYALLNLALSGGDK
jgi:flagellar basal-body rod protein FlgB